MIITKNQWYRHSNFEKILRKSFLIWKFVTEKFWFFVEIYTPALPLTGALKWGTVWTSTSTGTGIMKGQIWTTVFY